VQAVNLIGLANRLDFYWTLHAVFVSHPRQRLIFDQAVEVFWKNHKILERSIAGLLPEIRVPQSEEKPKELARRLSESLYLNQPLASSENDQEQQIELKASATYSDRERLQQTDFDAMSKEEMEKAKQVVAKMRLAFDQIKTRRKEIHAAGNMLNMRKTLSQSLRSGNDVIDLVHNRNKRQMMPVIVLCDISGSMIEYSRVILHFSHVMALARSKVWSFVFGTRLSNITRYMKFRDVDRALDAVAQNVEDWYGGTRIADCLLDFNRVWVRRLPLHQSIVLLVTDGLDRSESNDLEAQISRLHRSCKQLIWLNPLLRYAAFEPKVNSIRTLLRHVDAFLPVHNLNSMQNLSELLCESADRSRPLLQSNREFWKQKMHPTLNPNLTTPSV